MAVSDAQLSASNWVTAKQASLANCDDLINVEEQTQPTHRALQKS